MGKVVIYLRRSDEDFLEEAGVDPDRWVRDTVSRALEARRGVTYTEHPEEVIAWMLGVAIPEREVAVVGAETPSGDFDLPPGASRSEMADSPEMADYLLSIESRLLNLEAKVEGGE